MSRKSRGFTLIEVMIVVVIIGLLAAIAYPSYTAYVERGLQREAQGQIVELASALERYRSKNFYLNCRSFEEDGPEETVEDGPWEGQDAYTAVCDAFHRKSSPLQAS